MPLSIIGAKRGINEKVKIINNNACLYILPVFTFLRDFDIRVFWVLIFFKNTINIIPKNPAITKHMRGR